MEGEGVEHHEPLPSPVSTPLLGTHWRWVINGVRRWRKFTNVFPGGGRGDRTNRTGYVFWQLKRRQQVMCDSCRERPTRIVGSAEANKKMGKKNHKTFKAHIEINIITCIFIRIPVTLNFPTKTKPNQIKVGAISFVWPFLAPLFGHTLGVWLCSFLQFVLTHFENR